MLIRMLGIRFTNLIPGNYQINLFQDTQEMIKLYQAIDSVKRRFGEGMVVRGGGFSMGISNG
jgi:DNA polymerase-4